MHVQLVLTDYGQTLDAATIRALILRHVDTSAATLERIRIVHAIHDDIEVRLGVDDVLLATAWWTAFRAAATIEANPGLTNRRFVYLVQDDETLFYPASERQLMAERSYRLDVLPMVNSRPLATHLASATGRRSTTGSCSHRSSPSPTGSRCALLTTCCGSWSTAGRAWDATCSTQHCAASRCGRRSAGPEARPPRSRS
jgi:hypothetical protein